MRQEKRVQLEAVDLLTVTCFLNLQGPKMEVCSGSKHCPLLIDTSICKPSFSLNPVNMLMKGLLRFSQEFCRTFLLLKFYKVELWLFISAFLGLSMSSSHSKSLINKHQSVQMKERMH